MDQKKAKTLKFPFVTLPNNKLAVILEHKKYPDSTQLLVLPLIPVIEKLGLTMNCRYDDSSSEDETNEHSNTLNLPIIPSIKVTMDPTLALQHFNTVFYQLTPWFDPQATLTEKIMQVFYNSRRQQFSLRKDITRFITSLAENDTIHMLNIDPINELIESTQKITKNPNIHALINITTKYAQCINDMQKISRDYLSNQVYFDAYTFCWFILNAETICGIEEVAFRGFQKMMGENLFDPFQVPSVKDLITKLRDDLDKASTQKTTETIKEIGDFLGLESQQDKVEHSYGEALTDKFVIKRMHKYLNYNLKHVKLTQFINNLMLLGCEESSNKS